ncbi:MAG: hypothetical protein RL497_1429 [Pseudomonadota bacterium]
MAVCLRDAGNGELAKLNIPSCGESTLNLKTLRLFYDWLWAAGLALRTQWGYFYATCLCGKGNLNRLPLYNSDSTSIRLPCKSKIRFTIAKPSPVLVWL